MWEQIVIWVAMQVVSSFLLRPKNAEPTRTPGEVTGPLVDSSSPVPVLFGTRLLKEPNCVWYGDVGTSPIVRCGGGKK